MLTNQVQPKQENIPHEDGEWISFGQVGWGQMEEAANIKRTTAMAVFVNMPESVQSRLDKVAEDKATVVPDTSEVEDDPTLPFDKAFVLNASIKAWSYLDKELNKIPVTRDNIAALDEQTAEWAFGVAIRMNQRTKSEGEESAPNSSDTTSETGATQQS